jgi:hypothetical protein
MPKMMRRKSLLGEHSEVKTEDRDLGDSQSKDVEDLSEKVVLENVGYLVSLQRPHVLAQSIVNHCRFVRFYRYCYYPVQRKDLQNHAKTAGGMAKATTSPIVASSQDIGRPFLGRLAPSRSRYAIIATAMPTTPMVKKEAPLSRTGTPQPWPETFLVSVKIRKLVYGHSNSLPGSLTK